MIFSDIIIHWMIVSVVVFPETVLFTLSFE